MAELPKDIHPNGVLGFSFLRNPKAYIH